MSPRPLVTPVSAASPEGGRGAVSLMEPLGEPVPTGPGPVESELRCDVELVAELVAGDQQALALLYERYATRAYSLARRICREPGLAEEAVQETFLVLWQAPARYDPCGGSFAAWLLTVVHHKAVDLVRREQVRRRAVLACTDDHEWLPQLCPDVAVLAAERAERVHAALRQLPVEQRRALMLAYYGGYTQREIGELTAAPLGTVKSRMFAALQRLHNMLAPHAVELRPE